MVNLIFEVHNYFSKSCINFDNTVTSFIYVIIYKEKQLFLFYNAIYTVFSIFTMLRYCILKYILKKTNKFCIKYKIIAHDKFSC